MSKAGASVILSRNQNLTWDVLLITSWFDVSLAVGFRVWGWNSVKRNHSLLLGTTWIPYLPFPDKFVSLYSKSRHCLCAHVWWGGGEGLFKGVNMSNYLDRFKMASCLLEAWWFLDFKPDRNIPLRSQKWKGNVLQNTWLQTNECQSPKRDDDMNDWCVKTCQDREDYKFTNSQIPRLLRQKVMVYCGINLQTSKALRNTNQHFLVWLKLGKSWSATNGWAFNLVDFLLFFMQITDYGSHVFA